MRKNLGKLLVSPFHECCKVKISDLFLWLIYFLWGDWKPLDQFHGEVFITLYLVLCMSLEDSNFSLKVCRKQGRNVLWKLFCVWSQEICDILFCHLILTLMLLSSMSCSVQWLKNSKEDMKVINEFTNKAHF